MRRSTGFLRRSQNSFFIIIAVILLIAFITLIIIFRSETDKNNERTFYPICDSMAKEYSLDPALVKAIIKAESGYDPLAVSKAGAKGLMQLMPETFSFVCKKYGIEENDIFDPENNVRAGCAYLDYLYSRFEITETVLAAYNAGEGNVSAWLSDKRYSSDGKTLENIPFPETRNYVMKVIRLRNGYEND